jgi:hypothetical protein
VLGATDQVFVVPGLLFNDPHDSRWSARAAGVVRRRVPRRGVAPARTPGRLPVLRVPDARSGRLPTGSLGFALAGGRARPARAECRRRGGAPRRRARLAGGSRGVPRTCTAPSTSSGRSTRPAACDGPGRRAPRRARPGRATWRRSTGSSTRCDRAGACESLTEAGAAARCASASQRPQVRALRCVDSGAHAIRVDLRGARRARAAVATPARRVRHAGLHAGSRRRPPMKGLTPGGSGRVHRRRRSSSATRTTCCCGRAASASRASAVQRRVHALADGRC